MRIKYGGVMSKLTFENRKEFCTESGKVFTMKSLITIKNKTQFIEVYGSDIIYSVNDLTEVKNGSN